MLNSNDGSTQLGLLVITSLSIVGMYLSWRQQTQLEEECTRLRRSLAERRRKQKSSSLSSSSSENNKENAKDDLRTRPDNGTNSWRTTLSETQSLMEDGLTVKPIGVIHSIYRLCVGTPRQGLLCPSARGVIEMFRLGNSSPVESVDGLEGYSHIWIVFIFHLNTQSRDVTRTNNNNKVKSKISPPAMGGGKKVGIYATRTPHRYNPIGLSLCKLDRIVKDDKGKGVRLHISGLDLVDGTPVLDIKPYVPVYDSVNDDGANNNKDEGVRVPGWVAGGLSMKRSITVMPSAINDLKMILQTNPEALEFYGPKFGEKTIEATIATMIDCIQQVLSIDVRSSYQTMKSRDGKFQAERSQRFHRSEIIESTPSRPLLSTDENKTCTQQLDNLLIHYQIHEPDEIQRLSSSHSGAEDILQVTAIEWLPG